MAEFGRRFNVACMLFMFGPGSFALAGDWPQWRYDANRSAASPHELPAELHVQWVRQYPRLEPAWEDPVNQDRMPFDRVYEPVVMGSTLFFGSNRNDRMTALDTRTGREKWRFYAEGPIRFAPVASQGRVYFVSDDGFLYCLAAETGELIWKRRGGPTERKVLGNSRLISAWPARGGPVLEDGRIYFAASIWPFMGVFIHAVDADSGELIWTNDGLGSNYMDQPHGGAVSFGGIAPQGALAVVGDHVLVPGGRSVPACLDRATGQQKYFFLSGSPTHEFAGGIDRKLEGGSHVCGIGNFYLNHRGLQTTIYNLATGGAYLMWQGTTYPVLTDDVCYLSGQPVIARSLAGLEKVCVEEKKTDRKTGKEEVHRKYHWEIPELWKIDVDGSGALIRSGKRLYAGGKQSVTALDLAEIGPPTVSWRAEVKGTVARLIAADDRLFAITLEGRMYAFGPDNVQPESYEQPEVERRVLPGDVTRLARRLLGKTTIKKGYCLVYGIGNGDLAEAIVRESDFRVIAVDPRAEKVDAMRRRLDQTEVYGDRITVHCEDPVTFQPPPYLAALTVCENPGVVDGEKGEAFIKALYASVRPYGGLVYLPISGTAAQREFENRVAAAGMPNASVARTYGYVLLIREGPLPGAADWTHQSGDIANTAKSDDARVMPPLGLLWFGGNSHMDVLPRHAHGPSEQVVGGRLFIQGINMLSARDVYTGQVLWKRTFDDLGTSGIYYDGSYRPDPLDTSYNQQHIPGANARGTNYVALEDRVYLLNGPDCLVLDAVNGETLTQFRLPADADAETPPDWGYIGVYQDLLIAGSRLARFSKQYGLKADTWTNFDVTSSRQLVVMERSTGDVIWTRDAAAAFRHNAIAVGADRVFCIDSYPRPVLEKLDRRGERPEGRPELLALNVKSGDVVWRDTQRVFGTWLAYSDEHDLLVQSGRNSRDMIQGEPEDRIVVYRGGDGKLVWDKQIHHSGPLMLHGETIYLNARDSEASAVSLLTGEPVMRHHPMSGEQLPWAYHRTYGCNSVVASEHLLTFRSGAAGFYDLTSNAGTGNIGGFKSGCTSNLIVADGVLNAPDYTRTCTCSYQNQTSLALIHMPEVEMWFCSKLGRPAEPVTRVGLNFGAPGDRGDSNGTLWLDAPSVGGPSPDLPVTFEPQRAIPQGDGKTKKVFAGVAFRHHASRVVSGELPWVAASGLKGVTGLAVTLGPEDSRPQDYTVRLVFAEPEETEPGRRVFDVAIQGEPQLDGFDIVKEAGGPNRTVVKVFNGVRVGKDLRIALTPQTGQPLICGVELLRQVN